jgi:hypothetical protein
VIICTFSGAIVPNGVLSYKTIKTNKDRKMLDGITLLCYLKSTSTKTFFMFNGMFISFVSTLIVNVIAPLFL